MDKRLAHRYVIGYIGLIYSVPSKHHHMSGIKNHNHNPIDRNRISRYQHNEQARTALKFSLMLMPVIWAYVKSQESVVNVL